MQGSGWIGLGFRMGFGFGSVGSLAFCGPQGGSSCGAASCRGMVVEHVLGSGCCGSSFCGGAFSWWALFLGGWWGHICAVCVSFVCSFCFGCSLLHSVLRCMACCGVGVVVLCAAALTSGCGCGRVGVAELCACIGLLGLILGWGLLICWMVPGGLCVLLPFLPGCGCCLVPGAQLALPLGFGGGWACWSCALLCVAYFVCAGPGGLLLCLEWGRILGRLGASGWLLFVGGRWLPGAANWVTGLGIEV
ncbi:hypothetical protein AMECASPLE_033427 [Ameca splendens]|uniref:Uncharacterized protein n=1 Tax=Ameca splendens TaxID=208324 RepID=A0ABV1AF03_9TELE